MSSMHNNLPVGLTAYDGGGDASTPAGTTGFVTLDVDTHYFPIPENEGATLQSVHIQTDATIAGTFTVQGCNFPLKRQAAVTDTTDYDETSGGKWVPIDVAAAGWAQGVGTGWTITVLSLAKTAGAGSAIINLINPGFARLRLVAVVTTGGTCRVVAHGKG